MPGNSACPAATHAKVVVAGLTNELYTRLIGFKKKVLPQLAGPIMKMFWDFPSPLCKSSLTVLLNSSTDISFCYKDCSALKYQMCCSHFVSSLLKFQHDLYETFSFQKKN